MVSGGDLFNVIVRFGNRPNQVLSLRKRIFAVDCPFHRIVNDIPTDAIKRIFVTNDVFVIIALPTHHAWGCMQFVDAFG